MFAYSLLYLFILFAAFLAEAAIGVIKRVMETASEPAVAFSVPLVVEARAAANWDDAH